MRGTGLVSSVVCGVLAFGCAVQSSDTQEDEVRSALTDVLFSAPQQWSNFFCLDGEDCKIADVNNDGRADAVAFNHGINGGATAVFVGLSNGASFGAPQQWSNSFCLANEICAMGDVNGDGRADLVAFTGNPSDRVLVSLSNGMSFGPPQLWSIFFCLTGEVCKLADVNGDGRADLIAFNHGINGGTTAVFVGLSNGMSFGAPQQWSGFFCLANEICEVADVDGNGRADLIAFTQGASPRAFVGLSTGTSFLAAQEWSNFFCLTGEVCRAADFDGDRRADIVAFNHGINGGTTAAFVATSTGTSFTQAAQASPFFCLVNETCEVGDVNADRKADIIAFTRGANPRAFAGISSP